MSCVHKGYYVCIHAMSPFGILNSPRARAVSNEPKEPKRASYDWRASREAHANMKEVLLYSLFVCAHADSVGDLNKWAQAVRAERLAATELKEQWKPPERAAVRRGRG